RHTDLLRYAISLVGTRHEREHQWPHPPIPAEKRPHENAHTGAMRRDRQDPQQSTQETSSLLHTHRDTQPPLPCATITHSQCRSSNLNLGGGIICDMERRPKAFAIM